MIRAVYEDDYLLVIDKPPGLVVDRCQTQTKPSLEEILLDEYQIKLERSGVVHRLDKDTSGLLLVAKTVETLKSLQAQFKARQVAKEYLCLVHGLVKEQGKIDAPIMRSPFDREKFMVFSDPRAREAVTEYEPLQNLEISEKRLREIFSDFSKIQLRKLANLHYPLFTLLQCHPLTGRTHQIRVHLKYLGFPVVSDEKYGGRKVVRLDQRWCPRQFLHAGKISFSHPISGKKMAFASKLPVDLEKALMNLENLAK